jgi:tyrosine decarboxylase
MFGFHCQFLQLGLVCFRLKGSDALNQKLLSEINASGKLHMVPASVNDKYVIRFCVTAQHATEQDIGKHKILTFHPFKKKYLPTTK